MAVQIGLLRKVVQHIAAHENAWDQGHWVRRTACGTTACLAGHTVLLAQRPVHGSLGPNDAGIEYMAFATDQYGSFVGIDEAAEDLLGLTYQQASRLFYWEPVASGVNALDQLAERVLEVTGVDVSDAVAAGREDFRHAQQHAIQAAGQ